MICIHLRLTLIVGASFHSDLHPFKADICNWGELFPAEGFFDWICLLLYLWKGKEIITVATRLRYFVYFYINIRIYIIYAYIYIKYCERPRVNEVNSRRELIIQSYEELKTTDISLNIEF